MSHSSFQGPVCSATLRSVCLSAFAALSLGGAVLAQEGEGEFSASGQNTVRIENEYKLRVPDAIVEDVWTWLQQHYADASFLDRDGHKFTSTFGDEHFLDTYFDDPSMKMLSWDSGVRHRRRVVLSGSAARKDGRELLQIKMNRSDASGMCRSEIKFVVDPPERAQSDEDLHPLLGLLARKERPVALERFASLGIDATALSPVLSVEQVRRRVYIGDQDGAFATLTLDQCSCNDYGADLRWTEIELELNEIRFTQSEPDMRNWMERVNDTIKKDLLDKFPSIQQDQTPKYTKAFLQLENATWLPLRTLRAWGVSAGDLRTLLVVFVAVLLGGGTLLALRLRRARLQKSA